jgi:Tfp pilus assembly protein FimT
MPLLILISGLIHFAEKMLGGSLESWILLENFLRSSRTEAVMNDTHHSVFRLVSRDFNGSFDGRALSDSGSWNKGQFILLL